MAKNWAERQYDTVQGTGILDPAGLFNTPEGSYLGGSREELAARRAQYQAGIGVGQGYTEGGVNTANQGVAILGGAAPQAQAMATQGQGIGMTGLSNQQAALNRQNQIGNMMMAQAAQQGPSAAQAQLQMGLDQSQRAMMAQAASARGGNQAAAMMGAQGNAAAMAGQVNQQAAVLRAQEAQQRQQNILGAQGQAAAMQGNAGQQYGQVGALGYGMQGQGIGQQAQIGSNIGSIGLGQAQAGNQAQSNYLGAQSEADKAQLDADLKHKSAVQANKGGPVTMITSAFK